MSITPAEREQLLDEFEAAKAQELSDRMRHAGRSRSPAKLRAARRNAVLARAAKKRYKKLPR